VLLAQPGHLGADDGLHDVIGPGPDKPLGLFHRVNRAGPEQQVGVLGLHEALQIGKNGKGIRTPVGKLKQPHAAFVAGLQHQAGVGGFGVVKHGNQRAAQPLGHGIGAGKSGHINGDENELPDMGGLPVSTGVAPEGGKGILIKGRAGVPPPLRTGRTRLASRGNAPQVPACPSHKPVGTQRRVLTENARAIT
jgi:hypothetical protein